MQPLSQSPAEKPYAPQSRNQRVGPAHHAEGPFATTKMPVGAFVVAGVRSIMIEVNGMAHVILTVSQWEKARAFYAELLPFLGMTKVYDGNNFLYHVGGRTAIGIQRCAPEHVGERFVQNRIGLHHLCLRARSREDVDAAASKVRAIGGHIDRGPLEGDFAPGYYFFVFEDPDGIRLEVNFIPGKGLLVSRDQPLIPSTDPDWNQNP